MTPVFTLVTFVEVAEDQQLFPTIVEEFLDDIRNWFSVEALGYCLLCANSRLLESFAALDRTGHPLRRFLGHLFLVVEKFLQLCVDGIEHIDTVLKLFENLAHVRIDLGVVGPAVVVILVPTHSRLGKKIQKLAGGV